LGERHERQRAAFALVVGHQQDGDVFDRDDEDQGPQNQRQNAEDDVPRQRASPRRRSRRLLERVEGAGTNIAVDDPDGAERKGPEARLRVSFWKRGDGRGRGIGVPGSEGVLRGHMLSGSVGSARIHLSAAVSRLDAASPG
jgi:hypothetical protein